MFMFNIIVFRIVCVLGGYDKLRVGLWLLLLKFVVLRWIDIGSCLFIDIIIMENDCDL